MAESTLSARALGDPARRVARRRQRPITALADRIRLLILDGRIPLDTRLPAERDLAERARPQPHHRHGGLRRAARARLPRQRARLGQRRAAAGQRRRRCSAPRRRRATSTSARPRCPRCRGCADGAPRARVDDAAALTSATPGSTRSALRALRAGASPTATPRADCRPTPDADHGHHRRAARDRPARPHARRPRRPRPRRGADLPARLRGAPRGRRATRARRRSRPIGEPRDADGLGRGRGHRAGDPAHQPGRSATSCPTSTTRPGAR